MTDNQELAGQAHLPCYFFSDARLRQANCFLCNEVLISCPVTDRSRQRFRPSPGNRGRSKCLTVRCEYAFMILCEQLSNFPLSFCERQKRGPPRGVSHSSPCLRERSRPNSVDLRTSPRGRSVVPNSLPLATRAAHRSTSRTRIWRDPSPTKMLC
jgi:hypothetical protein